MLWRKNSAMFSHSMLSALPWENNPPASLSHIPRYAQFWEKPYRCVLRPPSPHIHMGENFVQNPPTIPKRSSHGRTSAEFKGHIMRTPALKAQNLYFIYKFHKHIFYIFFINRKKCRMGLPRKKRSIKMPRLVRSTPPSLPAIPLPRLL